MNNFKILDPRIAVLLLSLLNLLYSVSSCADDKQVVAGDSAAYKNTLQVHDFLLNSNQLELAAYLSVILEKGRLHWMTKKDFWGNDREEEGLAYLSGKVYVREDVMQIGHAFDMLNTQNSSGFGPGAAYMNVLIHEIFHIKDFQSSPISYEQETYSRSFITFREILLDTLIKNYQLHDSIGSPDRETWLNRVRIYAQLFHQELGTYSVQKYGEVPALKPLYEHQGCVRPQLTRDEMALYVLQLGVTWNANKTYQENFKNFDRWARFTFPESNKPECIHKEPVILRYDQKLPVGFQGMRLHQRIFEAEANLEEGHFVRVSKVGGPAQNANVTITIAEESNANPDQQPRPLNKLGSIYSWHKWGEVRMGHQTRKVKIIVSENSEGALPTKMELRFSHLFKDNEGNWKEGFLPTRELAPEEQARYGFYPIAEKIVPVTFQKNSPRFVEDLTHHQEGVRFTVQKGDYLFLKAPMLDNRSIYLYRLKPASSPYTFLNLENKALMFSWHESLGYTFEESGEYWLIAERSESIMDNRSFELALQFSRNGQTSPQQIPVSTLKLDDHAKVGAHPAHFQSLSLLIEPEKAPLGFGTQALNFYPFTMVSLNTVKGDYLNFPRLPSQFQNATTYVVVENTPNQLEIKATFYSFYGSGHYYVDSHQPHYLVVSLGQEFLPISNVTLDIVRAKRSLESPSLVVPKILSTTELARFGFFPQKKIQLENAALTALHPTGFVYRNYQYQHYLITLPKSARVRLNKGRTGLAERRFVVSKIDEASWQSDPEKPALIDVLRSYSWYSENTLDLAAGRYIITIEGQLEFDNNGNKITAFTPWEILVSGKLFDPQNLEVRPLTYGEMLDRRLRLKAL